MQPAKMGSAQSSEEQSWQEALEANTPDAYHGYLSAYPAGEYVRDAVEALRKLGGGTRAIGNTGSSGGSGSSGGLY